MEYLFNVLRNNGIIFQNESELQEIIEREAQVLYDMLVPNSPVMKEIKARINKQQKNFLEKMKLKLYVKA